MVVEELEYEPIEVNIKRTPFKEIQEKFNKDLHIYYQDETGNAEFISVTTLVQRFFQFDLLRYIERKAIEENKSEDVVLDEHLFKTYEAAILGTGLHKQIENYYKNIPFDDKFDNILQEFNYFLNFEKEKNYSKRSNIYRSRKENILP